jgi:hypothetical protein
MLTKGKGNIEYFYIYKSTRIYIYIIYKYYIENLFGLLGHPLEYNDCIQPGSLRAIGRLHGAYLLLLSQFNYHLN